MFVKLKQSGYSFDENITDQKVIAVPVDGALGGIDVRLSELLRVGFIDVDYIGGEQSIPTETAASTRFFVEGEYEIVTPTLENCSASNVGSRWDGYYDQKPIKKSKFR